MFPPGSGKATANEKKYPNIVELAVPADGLEIELSAGLWIFISCDTFNRDMGVGLLKRTKPIVAGALAIWRRLGPLSNSLADKLLMRYEARRIAANIAKLPER